MKRFLNWLDDRTGYREIAKDALYENVPGGARWRYVWGSTLVFAFVVQAVTGFFLWAAYSSNAQGAWESVYYIQHEMQAGWLLRGVHHFMAQAMVVLLVLHLMQVVIGGAYKAPREINFWLGLVLMLITLGLSLTGYLLPWDQKGFWATKVATNIMGITPGVGPDMQKVVVGGTEYGHHTLTRFFAIHAGLLPALLIGFLAVHIYVFRRHGIHTVNAKRENDAHFWPDQVLKDAVACLAVLVAVLFFVIGMPLMNGAPFGAEMGAHLGAPADPTDQYSAARPEWYFLFLFQLLKYFPGETEVIGAHVIPALVLLIIFLMPFFGRWKLGHRFNVGFLCALLIGIGVLTGLAMREDGDSKEFVHAQGEAERVAHRMPVLVAEHGIRTDGAVVLVRNDPYIQGPILFAKYCSSCHRYDGHDGRGRLVMEQIKDGKGVARSVAAVPDAADLGGIGGVDWWKTTLTGFKGHIGRHLGLSEEDQQDGMIGWSQENKDALTDPKNADDVKALYEYLASLGSRSDRTYDARLIEQGRKIATGDVSLKVGELTACTDCHTTVGDKFELTGEDNFGIPDIADYGSKQWLTAFLSDPGSEQFYGEKNKMPAFKNKMPKRELDMLVRWLTGDYNHTGTKEYKSKRKELQEALKKRPPAKKHTH